MNHLPHTDQIKLDWREDIGSNASTAPHLNDMIAQRLSRRDVLMGTLMGAALSALPAARAADSPSSLTFPELAPRIAERDSVADGYEIQTLIRWGDAVLPDAPRFDPHNQTAAAQAAQFGYNNDYIGWHTLPRGARNGEHGLLVINHEYTNTGLMFAGLGADDTASLRTSAAQVAIEIAAHGMSVIEVRRQAGVWRVVEKSPYARRITGQTPMRISGPAAGHARMKTAEDPSGTLVLGTLNNCAGGNTPWGTALSAEENFNQYFGGNAAENGPQSAAYKRYGISKAAVYAWAHTEPRFNLDSTPNEPNRFGWVVEFDPYDPHAVPVKRTALGRFKHEGATHAIDRSGRVVIYMGDDERNDYLYKFVTARAWTPDNPAANRDLLDDGTLFVAQFADDGTLRWLPLVHGEGPLTAANGFHTQADVLIETRRAADLLRATPMDRPEDVETNPANGRVYVMLTNNTKRTAQTVNAANPRPDNVHGHVVEIIPPGAGTARVDHAGTTGRWEIFLMAGRPGTDPDAQYHRSTSPHGWLSCPDNCAFDSKGRIWIATDGAPRTMKIADGLWGADTDGNGRALPRLFYQAPIGAEVCGPVVTPDDRTIFLSIQHPGEGGTFDAPATRWPDFRHDTPPRPSVIAIVRRNGGVIGD